MIIAVSILIAFAKICQWEEWLNIVALINEIT